MTSPFERFTRPSDQFELAATEVHNLAETMAEEDAELTIAFLLSGIIHLAMAHEIPPEALVREFQNAIASFRLAIKTADQLAGSTEH